MKKYIVIVVLAAIYGAISMHMLRTLYLYINVEKFPIESDIIIEPDVITYDTIIGGSYEFINTITGSYNIAIGYQAATHTHAE